MNSVKIALSNGFLEQAEWRRGKAEEYPDDYRNLQAAEGLAALAKWVQELDDADPRLAKLGALYDFDSLDSDAGGEEGSRLASRFRFDRADESFDEFLDSFVKAEIQDAMLNADEPFEDL
jgi:hypothetical protein